LEFYVRIVREGRTPYWPWFIAGVLGLAGIVVFIKRKLRERVTGMGRLDISESDIIVLNGASNVSLPWTVFGQCLESPNLFVLVDRAKSTLIIVPKRAFPSESWQTWFREQTKLRVNSAEPIAASTTSTILPVKANQLLLKFQFGFRDYVVRMLVSWRLRGIFAGMILFMGIICIIQAINPPPDAVNSAAKVFFVFALPMLTGLFPFVALLISLITWLTHRKHHGPQQVALSDESVAFSGPDGTGTVAWSGFKFYKETCWCFILWRGSLSLMLPKRALVSSEEMRRCREFLARNLQRSRWFVG
jgi:hypothetical protein